MTDEQDRARLLAERIARRLAGQQPDASPTTSREAAEVSEELSAMRANLSELQQRLTRIESRLTERADTRSSDPRETHADSSSLAAKGSFDNRATQTATAVHSPWLSGQYFPATHPSEERFGVEEMVVSELVDFFEGEKKCELEPGGKPCDHCAMCSSRGF